MFDPVQPPPLGHAFESVNATILKADSRLRHQILDRARDQDFAGTRLRGDTRADVKRETDHVSPITLYSPVCSPTLISSPSVRTASRIAIAQRIPEAGASNVASSPSPVVTTSFPRKVFSSLRTAA
jgi:hypothetical protein